MKQTCACGAIRRPNQKNCAACHRAAQRKWRKANRLSPKQLARANARAYANTYKRRGKLIPQPCQECGNPRVEMHHSDYSQPLKVRWLCRRHHLALERLKRQRAA